MVRAANALLYRRHDRAAELQDEAASQLDTLLARNIDQVRSRFPGRLDGPARTLARTVAQRRARGGFHAQATAPGRRRTRRAARMRQDWSGRIDMLGESLDSDDLQRAAQALQRPGTGGPSADLEQTAALLREAEAVLAEFVRGEIPLGGRVRLNRRTAAPPEKYREEVERYFRSLAEEP